MVVLGCYCSETIAILDLCSVNKLGTYAICIYSMIVILGFLANVITRNQ